MGLTSCLKQPFLADRAWGMGNKRTAAESGSLVTKISVKRSSDSGGAGRRAEGRLGSEVVSHGGQHLSDRLVAQTLGFRQGCVVRSGQFS